MQSPITATGLPLCGLCLPTCRHLKVNNKFRFRLAPLADFLLRIPAPFLPPLSLSATDSAIAPTHHLWLHLVYRSSMACASNWPTTSTTTPPERRLRGIQPGIACGGAAWRPSSRCGFCSSTMTPSTGECSSPEQCTEKLLLNFAFVRLSSRNLFKNR